MRSLLLVLILLVSTGCSRESGELPTEGEWTLRWVDAPEDSITIGDPIRVRLAGTLPARGRILQSPWATLSQDFVVRDSQDTRQSHPSDSLTALRQDVTLVPFQVGPLQVGPLTIPVVAGGDTLLYMSDTLLVQVASVLGDSAAADLRDIKPPFPLSREWWPFAAAAAALLLALIVGGLLWRRNRAEAKRERPLPPPWEEFKKGLAALEAKDLPGTGQWGKFTLRLSWLVRRYLERRFEAPVLEMTTLEIRGWVTDADLHAKQENRLLHWLSRTDLIKFAGSVPTLGECRELGDEARDLVSGLETYWKERQSQGEKTPQEPFLEKTGTENST